MPPFRISRPARLIVVVVLLLGMTACRQSAGGVPLDRSAPEDGAADVALTLSPASDERMAMGPFEWIVQLTNSDGTPVEGAAIELRGDMNHAGMVPVEATATEIGEGIYRADFEWTMAGEWIVTATATLPDGRVKSETFTYNAFVR